MQLFVVLTGGTVWPKPDKEDLRRPYFTYLLEDLEKQQPSLALLGCQHCWHPAGHQAPKASAVSPKQWWKACFAALQTHLNSKSRAEGKAPGGESLFIRGQA